MFKKLLGLFALASFFTIPAVSFALPMPTVYNTNMAEKEVSSDTEGGFIRLKGFVCKTSDCSLANADDWYNYRSEPTVEGEETGDGKTLYVSPGDNLTFLAGVTSVTQEGYYPKFSVAFTGDEYITSPDFFGTGQDDLDGDGIFYEGDESLIDFSIPITTNNDAQSNMQFGSVTAKVKNDAPDGAVIVAEFIYNGEGNYVSSYTFNPFMRSAQAATLDENTLAYSSVRIVVSNPTAQIQTTTVTTPTTLPKTGNVGGLNNKILPGALMSVVLGFVGYQIVSRKRKQTK